MMLLSARPLLVSSSIALAFALFACGGASSPPNAPSLSASPGSADRGAEAGAGANEARDPKIVALANAALACPVEDGAFQEGCPAFTAWVENEELFADGNGDATIFAMLGDSDEKVRMLAAEKSIDAGEFFSDKARATKLFAIAKKETNANVANVLGGYVVNVDAETLGLGVELRALAKHPVPGFRTTLASYLAVKFQSPSALEVVELLIDDSERSVRRAAIGSLSSGGRTPPVEPVCELLTKQFSRTDDLVATALQAGSSSRCADMGDVVVDELTKRVADPATITNSVGVGFAFAASAVCNRTSTFAVKKKGYEVGRKLADKKVQDPNTRRAAMNVLASCDPAAAQGALAEFAKDKDAFVAKAAAEERAKLQKK